MFHPWRQWRALSHWDIVWADGGPKGRISFSTRTVTLRRDLTYAQRRSVLEHERQHALRGPVVDDPALMAKDEAACDRIAARNLIEIHDLGDALAWSGGLQEVADELDVDVRHVRVRLATLASCEHRYLEGRLGDGEPSEPYCCPHDCAERARLGI